MRIRSPWKTLAGIENMIREQSNCDEAQNYGNHAFQQRIRELTKRLAELSQENCRLRASLGAEEVRNMDLEQELAYAKQELLEYKNVFAIFQQDVAKLNWREDN